MYKLGSVTLIHEERQQCHSFHLESMANFVTLGLNLQSPDERVNTALPLFCPPVWFDFDWLPWGWEGKGAQWLSLWLSDQKIVQYVQLPELPRSVAPDLEQVP